VISDSIPMEDNREDEFELETDSMVHIHNVEENSVEYDSTEDSREGIYIYKYMWISTWICMYIYIHLCMPVNVCNLCTI
jgi:hypothetical protein